MTVSSSTARADYTGNGVTVAFPVPFRFLEDGDIQVLRSNIADGTYTVLTLNSLGADGFSLVGAGKPAGGTATVVTAPGNGTQRLTILRDVDATQLTDYIANDPFPAESHERALDKLTMLVQAQGEELGRALKLVPVDVDGSGRYDARGNRIFSMGDGIDAQDAATMSNLAAAIAGVVIGFEGFVSVKTFGAVGDNVADDTAAIILAAASGKSFYFPPGDYKVTGTGAAFTLANQQVWGLGDANIRVTGTQGMHVTSASNSEIKGLRFVGSGSTDGKVGLRIGDYDMTAVVGNTFDSLQEGLISDPKVREVWYGGNNFVPSSIESNRFILCGYGCQLKNESEYVTVSKNFAFGCSTAGFYSETGNSPIQDNQAIACEIGFWIKGANTDPTLVNPDHSVFCGNTANHCNSAGILLDGLSISWNMDGNNCWATNASGNLFGLGRGYGLYLRDCRRVISRGNVWANMTYPVGFDGIAECSFDDLIDNTASTLNQFFWCDGNGSFTENRNSEFKIAPNSQGTAPVVIGNRTAGANTKFYIDCKMQASSVTLTSGTASPYVLDGRHKVVYAQGGFTQGIVIPDFLNGIAFDIHVNNVLPGAPVGVTLPTGTSAVLATPNAGVAGTAVTLWGNDSRFRFTPIPGGFWKIDAVGDEIAPAQATGTGTAYTLTTTVAAVDFGTTDPALVIPKPGTYRLRGQFQVDGAGATVGTTQSLDLRIRRTNNTAANVDSLLIDLPAQTAATTTVGVWTLECLYTTAASNDAVALFAGLTAALGAGTMSVVKASISAERLY